MKKKKKLPVFEILFTYLAVTKVLYWVGVFAGLSSFGDIAENVLTRLLNQDAVVVIMIFVFFYLDRAIYLKSEKFKGILAHAAFYAIGYGIFIGVAMAHASMMLWLSFWNVDSLPVFFVNLVVNYTIGFVAIMVVMNIKILMKKKAKEEAAGLEGEGVDKYNR